MWKYNITFQYILSYFFTFKAMFRNSQEMLGGSLKECRKYLRFISDMLCILF
jgi:hypothetical protein